MSRNKVLFFSMHNMTATVCETILPTPKTPSPLAHKHRSYQNEDCGETGPEGRPLKPARGELDVRPRFQAWMEEHRANSGPKVVANNFIASILHSAAPRCSLKLSVALLTGFIRDVPKKTSSLSWTFLRSGPKTLPDEQRPGEWSFASIVPSSKLSNANDS